MSRVLLLLAVSLGLLVLTPSPSWACSCADVPTARHVQDAVTVAAGTVDWTATDGQTRTYQVDFDAVYKGAAGGSEKLSTAATDSACGVGDLATGRRYLFFIEGQHPGAMRISLCGGTTAYADDVAREVEAVTGPPGKPLPGSATSPPTVGSGGPGVTRALAFGAGAAVLAGLAVGLTLTRRGGATRRGTS